MPQIRVSSDWVYRALPFLAYIFLMAASGFVEIQGIDYIGFYLFRIAVAALLLLAFFRHFSELSWPPVLAFRQVLLSLAVGLAVFFVWIQLDHGWMVAGEGSPFNPYGADGQMDFSLVLLRGLGAALVVPLMEELFWRSFLMRWIDRPDFLGLSPVGVSVKALLVSSVLFALEHTLWLAGLLAGLVYGWLYIRTSNLWAPVLAHTVTNSVLGIWVVFTGSWKFW